MIHHMARGPWHDERPLPLPFGYWVPGLELFAGEYPGAKYGAEAVPRLERLVEAGFTCFVDLTEEGELIPYEPLLEQVWGDRPVFYQRHPIRDVSVPKNEGEMNAILDSLEVALALGHRIYVHCWGGVGRTGTTVGCLLVRHGLDGEEALGEVARLFGRTIKNERESPETDQQREYVISWSDRDRFAENKWGRGHDEAPVGRGTGALVGLAVGDALGTTLEFKAPGSFQPISDMVGGGPFDLPPGAWTDDTSMALCLAESLVESRGMDLQDQMERYVRWWREGHLSSTGRCFDIGTTTRQALDRFQRTGEPLAGSTDPHSAGNGSLMRLAPVAMYFHDDLTAAVNHAGESSRTTHGAPTAVDSCRLFAALLVSAIHGAPKSEFLSWSWISALPGLRARELNPEVRAVAEGSFLEKNPPDIQGSGFVVRSLEAALWAFASTSTFEEGALKAVNLGDDADTTGAIYGQIAGAHYGLEAIPLAWRSRLVHEQLINTFAHELMKGLRSISSARYANAVVHARRGLIRHGGDPVAAAAELDSAGSDHPSMGAGWMFQRAAQMLRGEAVEGMAWTR